MPVDDHWLKEFYNGLKVLENFSFPKRCQTCGKEYRNLDEYLKETGAATDSSGLMQAIDDDDNPIVGLFRNCICGSTLMITCGNRRDMSEQGQKQRDVFQKLLDLMEQRGIPPSMARPELIKIMNGQPSELIQGLNPDHVMDDNTPI